jgi:ATP-dependent Zn protease
MTVFYHIILKAINSYKAMLRRNLPASECVAKVRKLGIKRAYIKNADEIKLYVIGLKIIEELEQHVALSKREKSVNSYYGAEEFLQYLKKLLTEYITEDGKIVNTGQKSSCVLVNFIQLMDMTKEKLTDEVAQQIHSCVHIIVKYGSEEQKRIFNKILKSDQPRHMSFFFRQLQNLVSSLALDG